MRKHLNEKVLVRGLIIAMVAFAIVALATPVGKQMQKLPAFDKVGMIILIEEGLQN